MKHDKSVLLLLFLVGLNAFAFIQAKLFYFSEVKIPMANQTISSREIITSEMITFVEVPKVFINEKIVTSVDDIVGKYVKMNTVLPQGTLFYHEVLTTIEQFPDDVFNDLPDGYVAVPLSVDIVSTIGNSFIPKQKVDIYASIKIKDAVLFDRILANVEIVAIRDEFGLDVFEAEIGDRKPAVAIVSIHQDAVELLHLALEKGEIELRSGVSRLSNDNEMMIIEDSLIVKGLQP